MTSPAKPPRSSALAYNAMTRAALRFLTAERARAKQPIPPAAGPTVKIKRP